jgi:hypothetical protein
MAISFPTSLDSLTNPATTDPRNSPSHAGQHADANDAIEALEAKIGVDGSAVTTSLDYYAKSKVDPGHTHTAYAASAKGVTNGDSHDHVGGDGGQIDHGGLAGLSDDDHTQYIKHSLATATSDFLAASGAGTFVKKTLAEVKTLLGLGTAAYTASTDYAVTAKGVTNGDSHDHNGGDGAAIVEAAITLADNTTNDVSITKHGFAPKAPNNTTSFLRGDGTWATPTGGGDFAGPASSTDNAIVRFDGTTGKTGQTSLATIDDSGSVNIPTGQAYKINNTALAVANITGAAPLNSPTFTGTVTVPTGLTGVLRADTGVVSVDSDVTDIVAAASDTAAGKVELATVAETTTGTDTARAVTPDGLAGSNFGKRIVQLKICDDATVLTTGDGKLIFMIGEELNGMNLIAAHAGVSTVSSSGNPTIMIRNATDAQDMLSTAITIDATEFTSYTALTGCTINASYDDVATGDRIAINVTTAGTGTKGLIVHLVFQLP